MPVVNSLLVFLAALKCWPKEGGVSSMFKTPSLHLLHPKLCFRKFGTKKSPMR